MKNFFTFTLAFILAISLVSNKADAQIYEADSIALMRLYENCNGANWTGFDHWMDAPVTEWDGVYLTWIKNEAGTDSTLRVTNVDFFNMTLEGTLPSELGDLTEMSGKIQLHNQPGLTGEFPAFIWNWTKVERLQIKWCGFTSMDVTGIENMVNLYEINTQGTPFTGEIPVEIFELPLMRDIYLESGNWSSLPAGLPIPTPTPLRRFYINDNQFTDVPDLTGMVWASGAKIKFQDNMLGFDDLAPNMWIASDANVEAFSYSPQATVGDDVVVFGDAGSSVTISSNIAGTASTVYTWIKGIDEVVASGSDADLTFASFDPATETGSYFCLAQDPGVAGLDLLTGTTQLYENPTAMDSLALVAFYNECGGTGWTGFDNWLTGTLDTWEGVYLTAVTDGAETYNRVSNLDFFNMTLTGTLPEELGNLTEMSGKIQIHNQPGLTGEFPAFIWNWTKVERMQIKWCGFTSIDVTGIEKMVNMYEINTQETPFEGEIPVEIFELPAMRDIYMESGKWTSLPADLPIPTPTPLRRFYLNGNQFTDIPDLTGMVWAAGAKIKFQDNMLSFDDLAPNMWISSDANVEAFTYSPQAVVGDDGVVFVDAGTAVTVNSNITGTSSTVYTWMKGADNTVVQTGSLADLVINAFDPATQTGSYFCLAQDASVAGLDILTAKTQLFENATVMDSLALVALYNECNGANWTGFDTWLTGELEDWEGVYTTWIKNEAGTDSTLRVNNVDFLNMTLTGTLPEELGNMTEMSGKIQIHNQPGLTGEFPAFIWNWTKVERMQIKWCGFNSMDVTGIEKMVNMYEINTQETPFEGEIPVEIFQLPAMRDIYMESGKWTSLPADLPIPTPTPLRRFYINGNLFTDVPDLTGMVWAEGAKIKFQDNMLHFDDLAPNMWIASDANVEAFSYSPQAKVGEDGYVHAAAGTSVTLNSNIGGTESTTYTWIKGVDEVVGSTADLTFDTFDPSTQSGTYFCLAQDATVSGLDIYTGNKMLWESDIAPDSLALVALYDECGGSSWTGFDTWLSGPVANWEGVYTEWIKNEAATDSMFRVVNVDFLNMTLTGTLPQELGNMTEMSGKIQMHNQTGLTGEFPAFIWNWTKVERMQIKWCGFTSIDVTGIEKMVNLYEFNTQETPFEGEIPAAIFNLPAMSDVYMESGQWTSLPMDLPIPTPTPLRRLYLNGNQFIDMPDLTGMVWAEGAKIKMQDNFLTFEDLEPNMWISSDANVEAFSYSPQAVLTDKETITVEKGDPVSMSVSCGGSSNTYTWVKDGAPIDGATSDQYDLAAADYADAGEYYCLVQSSLVPGLDLQSDTTTLVVNVPEGIESSSRMFSLNGNPVSNVLSIDADFTIDEVVIHDLTGKMLRTEQVNTDIIRMNVSDLNRGIYMVTLKSESELHLMKIIKK